MTKCNRPLDKNGVAWHRKDRLNADYTLEDGQAVRTICDGCINGKMRQLSTDHLREHRVNPTRPGQIFVMKTV